jgi:hypothetical protein
MPAKILPVANQAPHKTEGLPRRLNKLVTAGGVESRGKWSPQNQCFIRGDNIFEIIYIYIYIIKITVIDILILPTFLVIIHPDSWI